MKPIREVYHQKTKNKCQGCPLKLDETLSIENKPKHSKKKGGGERWRGYKERIGRPHVQEDKRTKGTSSF
jgi:hypothetical protein